MLSIVVFKAKVLESHYERLYGTVELSDSQSSSEDSESEIHSLTAGDKEVELLKGLLQDGHQSLHKQHKDFLERQVRQAERYQEKMKKLPKSVSSKRSLEDLTTAQDCVESMVKRFAADNDSEMSGTRRPRTVSNEEKNRRRKEKKRKAKVKKQTIRANESAT